MNTSKPFIQSLLSIRSPFYTARRNRAEPCKKFIKVTHCIFDLDGVILDNHKALDKTFKMVFENYSQKYTEEWRQKIMGMTGPAIWRKVIKELKLPLEWELMEETYVRTLAANLKNAPLRPGAERLITHLAKKNIPMALVTSLKQATMEETTKHIEHLLPHFEHVICGGDDPQIRNSKPARDIYMVTTMRFLGRPDGQTCLVFEDSPIGIRAARTACMQVVGVTCAPTTTWSLRHADEVVDTLEEFSPGKYGLPSLPKDDRPQES